MPKHTPKENVVTLVLDTTVIKSQVNINEEFEIYSYMDFNRKKVEVYVNDEVPFKLNIEKLAKKRLGIKNFWEEVNDIKFFVDLDKNEFCLNYHLKD